MIEQVNSNAATYVDVHTHLTHHMFDADRDQIIKKCLDDGIGRVIVNGLNPSSNREILAMSEKHPHIMAALGIYPVDAVWELLSEDFPHPVQGFSIQEEIDFIDQCARSKKIIAVGECGLDAHWLGAETFQRQEEVFVALLEVAMKNDLPVIIHTRKLEKRAMEILKHYGVKKVDFHCYGGKSKLALKAAEEEGWYFSIPANAGKNESFKKLLVYLPHDRVLTETDAPYLGPVRNTRNDPTNVIYTIDLFAKLRGWTHEQAKLVIWQNFCELFSINNTCK